MCISLYRRLCTCPCSPNLDGTTHNHLLQGVSCVVPIYRGLYAAPLQLPLQEVLCESPFRSSSVYLYLQEVPYVSPFRDGYLQSLLQAVKYSTPFLGHCVQVHDYCLLKSDVFFLKVLDTTPWCYAIVSQSVAMLISWK